MLVNVKDRERCRKRTHDHWSDLSYFAHILIGLHDALYPCSRELRLDLYATSIHLLHGSWRGATVGSLAFRLSAAASGCLCLRYRLWLFPCRVLLLLFLLLFDIAIVVIVASDLGGRAHTPVTGLHRHFRVRRVLLLEGGLLTKAEILIRVGLERLRWLLQRVVGECVT